MNEPRRAGSAINYEVLLLLAAVGFIAPLPRFRRVWRRDRARIVEEPT